MSKSDELLGNPVFVKAVKNNVTSRDLVSTYAPYMALRTMQEIAKKAREIDTPTPMSKPSWVTKLEDEKTCRIPPSTAKTYTDQWTLSGDFAVVTDIHVPFHHAPTLEKLIDVSEKAGVKDLIVGGDLVDGNQFHYQRGSMYQRRAQDDVEEARGVLTGLLGYFSNIYVFMGNHDLYIHKYMRNQFDPSFLYSKFFNELSPRVKWSDYGHCDVTSGGVKWKITHGANFSETNPVGIAKKLADKFRCNIIVGHQHRVEESHGNYHCICLGGALDSDRMAYLKLEPSTNATPRRSFGILKEGWFHHVTDC